MINLSQKRQLAVVVAVGLLVAAAIVIINIFYEPGHAVTAQVESYEPTSSQDSNLIVEPPSIVETSEATSKPEHEPEPESKPEPVSENPTEISVAPPVPSYAPEPEPISIAEVQAIVNINTADSETLQQLHRVGPVIAERIIDFRELHGPFMNIEDITLVRGIGPATFENLKDYISVE